MTHKNLDGMLFHMSVLLELKGQEKMNQWSGEDLAFQFLGSLCFLN